jgi:hypothetical protein
VEVLQTLAVRVHRVQAVGENEGIASLEGRQVGGQQLLVVELVEGVGPLPAQDPATGQVAGLEPAIQLGDLTVLRKGRLAFSSHLIRQPFLPMSAVSL